jgi:hypothetical protein
MRVLVVEGKDWVWWSQKKIGFFFFFCYKLFLILNNVCTNNLGFVKCMSCSWPCQDGRRVMTPGDRMGVGPVRPQNRPDKKQGEGFLGWSVGVQGFACSLRCFLFRFAFASLSPSPFFPPNASVVSSFQLCMVCRGIIRL